jgi:hypothetical protein
MDIIPHRVMAVEVMPYISVASFCAGCEDAYLFM